MAALQFHRQGAGRYAADVGDRIYFVTRAGDGWELSVHCSRFTDYLRPRSSRTKAACIAVARELESGRRNRRGR